METIEFSLLGWWLLAPALASTAFVLGAVKWRWRRLFVLAVMSMVVFAATVIVLVPSWSAIYQVYVCWDKPIGDHALRGWALGLRSNAGGLNAIFVTVDDPDSHLPRNRPAKCLLSRGPPGSVHQYPIWGNRYSVTKCDFLQQTLGFQLCWAPNIPDSPYRAWVAMYSATVPHWFVLLLCLPFPLFWLRRVRRLRQRTRHGLCLKCGYDLRESKSRCPECGTPIPTPPVTVKPAQSPTVA